jgi:extracellular elastinolytic metalloproteinase
MRYSLALTLLGATLNVYAHPSHTEPRWKKNLNKRTLELTDFRLDATSAYTGAAVAAKDASLHLLKRTDYVETASELVKSLFPNAEFRVHSNYIDNIGKGHVYLKQTVHGLDIDNADFNVNVSDAQIKWELTTIADLCSSLPMAPSSPTETTSSPERSPRRTPSPSVASLTPPWP